MINPKEYISQKQWQHKKNGKEFIIQECPICHDKKYHMYINAVTGLWTCHKCGESGNLFQLRKRLGDIQPITYIHTTQKKTPKPLDKDIDTPHAALLEHAEMIQWLKNERGLSEDTIKHFKLQFRKKHNKSWLGFPYFYNGQHVNTKWRTRDKKDKMEREPEQDSTLYNIDVLDKAMPVIIVEGEFDVLAAYELGFRNVVSVPNGASSLSDDWLGDLKDVPEILLALDNDEPGEKGAEKAAGILGRARCRRVRLPFKDLNECLIEGMAHEDVQEFLDGAERYKDIHSHSYTELISSYREYNKNKHIGVPTGWRSFDRQIGNIRNQEVTIITGHTSIGKTTFCCNIAYRLINHGVCFLTTENSSNNIINKLHSIHLQEPVTKKTPDSRVDVAYMFFTGKRLEFFNEDSIPSIDNISDFLIYHAQCGIKIAVIDVLQHCITAKRPEDERFEIEKTIHSLVRLAKITEMHLFVVCHPRKLQPTYNGIPPIVTPTDLKGSSAIYQSAHNILSLYRESKESNTVLHIQKVRDEAGMPGEVEFQFHHATQTYSEIEEGKNERNRQ